MTRAIHSCSAPASGHSAGAFLFTSKSELEKAIVKLVLPRLNRVSYGWSDGSARFQVSSARLDRHFQTVIAQQLHYPPPKFNPRNVIPKLSRKHVAAHQGGYRTLFVRSSWKGGHLLVRVDCDAHRAGQEIDECWRALEYIKSEYLPMLFISPSPRGASGYIWLQIPTHFNEHSGEVRPAATMREMNNFRQMLHKVIAPLMQSKVFKCGIECHGAFLQTAKEYDDTFGGNVVTSRKVAHKGLGAGTMARLPVFRSVAEVEEFVSATCPCHPGNSDLHHTGLARLIADGSAALAAFKAMQNKVKLYTLSDERVDAAMTALGINKYDSGDPAFVEQIVNWKPRKTKHHKATVDRVIIVDDPTDKLATARAVLIRARQLLGINSSADMDKNRADVLDVAHELYTENDLGSGGRDKKRDARFNAAFNFLLKTFDDTATGKGKSDLWFEDAHIATLAHKFDSVANIGRQIDIFNKSTKSKYGKLTSCILAITAATMAKDTIIGVKGAASNGSVPTNALRKMLCHPNFGLKLKPQSIGSLIAAAVKIICDSAGLLTCIAPAVKNGPLRGQCRKYKVIKWKWFSFLPQPVNSGHDDNNSNHVDSSQVSGGSPIFPSSRYKAEFPINLKGELPTPIDVYAALPDFTTMAMQLKRFMHQMPG